jgi:hypothetical protein
MRSKKLRSCFAILFSWEWVARLIEEIAIVQSKIAGEMGDPSLRILNGL